MKNIEIVEIIEDVINTYTDNLKKEIWNNKIWINELWVILIGLKTGMYKKIALYEENIEDDYLTTNWEYNKWITEA